MRKLYLFGQKMRNTFQEAAFYKTKTMYINLKNKKNRTNCL